MSPVWTQGRHEARYKHGVPGDGGAVQEAEAKGYMREVRIPAGYPPALERPGGLQPVPAKRGRALEELSVHP